MDRFVIFRRKGAVLWLASVTMFVMALSCNNNKVCLIPDTTSLHIQLSRWNGTAFVDTFMAQGRVFHGPQGNIMSTWQNTTRFTLPMPPAYDSLRFLIQADTLDIIPEHQEVVTLYFNRNLRFVSGTCGYFTEYTLNKVQYTGYILDTVYITTPKVTTDVNPTHLRFVLKS
jgi:hypothetical protein